MAYNGQVLLQVGYFIIVSPYCSLVLFNDEIRTFAGCYSSAETDVDSELTRPEKS